MDSQPRSRTTVLAETVRAMPEPRKKLLRRVAIGTGLLLTPAVIGSCIAAITPPPPKTNPEFTIYVGNEGKDFRSGAPMPTPSPMQTSRVRSGLYSGLVFSYQPGSVSTGTLTVTDRRPGNDAAIDIGVDCGSVDAVGQIYRNGQTVAETGTIPLGDTASGLCSDGRVRSDVTKNPAPYAVDALRLFERSVVNPAWDRLGPSAPYIKLLASASLHRGN